MLELANVSALWKTRCGEGKGLLKDMAGEVRWRFSHNLARVDSSSSKVEPIGMMRSGGILEILTCGKDNRTGIMWI